MELKELINYLTNGNKTSNPEIKFYIDGNLYHICSISQGNIIPDIHINLIKHKEE